jgi:hypothetical protein
MPITLVSSNLQAYGNAGAFETARASWGFADPVDYVVTRSLVLASAGLYSALAVQNVSLTNLLILPGAFVGEIGKTYVIRAKVRTPSGAPLSAGADEITLRGSLSNFMFGLTEISFSDKTVTEATDAWVDIEIKVEATGAPIGPMYEVWINLDGTGAGSGAQLHVDEFEIYEYTGEDDGDPEPEPEPEPEETDGLYHSKNPITLSKTATAGWDLLENPRLYADIRVEDIADGDVYNSKLTLALPPDEDGQALFYLNEAFRDAFTLTPPTAGASTIVRLTDRIKRFKVFTGEMDGTDLVPAALTEGDAHLVLFGGVDKFNFPTLDYLTTYLAANKKFLTWAPTEKYVDRLQEDYLNFFVYDPLTTTLKLQIQAFFDDDTDETAVATEISPVAHRQLYQVPAGPVNSGATLVNPAKNLLYYQLCILDQDDVVISEVRTYLVATTSHPLTRFFMFVNSLGAFEVLRFTGQAERTTEFGRELVQRFLPYNYSAEDGEFITNNNILIPKINYSSGNIKGRMAAQWHEYMQDFLNTSRLYEITATGQRLPLNITAGSWEDADQNYRRFIRFEVKPAYENQSFTPREI